MPKIFECVFPVTHEAIDENGHVNNIEYVRWMQQIAIHHSTVQGFGSKEYQDLGVTWVVRSHNIEYFAPAVNGDQVKGFTWVSSIGRAQSLRKYKFIRASDAKLLARAQTNWVFVNTTTGRPCTIHDAVAKAFDIVPENEEP